MTHSTVIKENEFFRITHDKYFGYFVDGKNRFGRWVVQGSFQNLGYKNDETIVEEVWELAEEKAKLLAEKAKLLPN